MIEKKKLWPNIHFRIVIGSQNAHRNTTEYLTEMHFCVLLLCSTAFILQMRFGPFALTAAHQIEQYPLSLYSK